MLKHMTESRGWSEREQGAITHLPDLAEEDTGGMFSRADYAKQRVHLQDFMNQVLAQLPDLSSEPLLKQFFEKVAFADERRGLLDDAIFESGADVNMDTIAGYWKLKDSTHLWCIESDGRATLNGKHRGDEYDVVERGRGFERVLTRKDGWSIDLQKSTANTLFWHSCTFREMEWTRVEKETAGRVIKKYVAKREELEKAKAEKEARVRLENIMS